jgi:hypothetical protein
MLVNARAQFVLLCAKLVKLASLWLGIMLQNNDPTVENISYILERKDFYLNFYDLREPYLLNIL